MLYRPVMAALLAALPLPALAAPAVVVDVPPVHSIVARVMEGVAEPTLLLAPGASPHDYALRPSDAQAIAQAGLLVWVGPSLDPWLAEAADALGGGARLILTEDAGVTLLPFRSRPPLFEDADAEDEHDHGHEAHAGEAGHAHDEHIDPHIWLDPRNAAAIADASAAALAEIDPENADRYAANAADFGREAADLESELSVKLAPSRHRGYVVFHDAYQYLENRFDLPSAGWILLGDGARPGAARVAALRETLQTSDVVCVFSEPEFEPKLVDTLIEGTGVRRGRLDGLGLGLQPGPGLWPALMHGLADGLGACLAHGS